MISVKRRQCILKLSVTVNNLPGSTRWILLFYYPWLIPPVQLKIVSFEADIFIKTSITEAPDPLLVVTILILVFHTCSDRFVLHAILMWARACPGLPGGLGINTTANYWQDIRPLKLS